MGHCVLIQMPFVILVLFFLSEEEWDAFPHPPAEYDSRCIMRYDFKTQTWKDARSLEQAKLHWENFIVNQEALLRSWAVSDILGIDSYNPITISAWNELVEACNTKNKWILLLKMRITCSSFDLC